MENRPEGVPDIPVLRKEDKEKKRGLGWLYRGSPSGPSGIAAAGARQAGGGLLATLTGKAAVAALALGVGGAGLVGYGYLSKGQAPAAKSPNLAPISSGLQVQKRNADGSRSLSYLADASKGEVKWDDPSMANAAGAKPGGPGGEAAAKEGGADAKAEGAMPDVAAMMAGAGAGAGGLGGPSGAKLSQGGSGQSSAFGSKSIFAGGSNNVRAPAMGAKPGAGQLALGRTATGGLSMRRGAERASARALSTRGAKSSRAMGQLRFTDRMSAQAKGAGGEQSSQYASDAFEQGKTQGGTVGGPAGASMGDTPMVMGGGGETPSGGGGYTQPAVGSGQNVTPYQGMVDGAKGMANTAILLYILAAALLVIAYYVRNIPYGWLIAAILIIIAVMLIAMGINMANMSKNMGGAVKDIYGQDEQGKIIEDEAEASKSGKHGNYKGDVKTRGTVNRDVAAERDATYQE